MLGLQVRGLVCTRVVQTFNLHSTLSQSMFTVTSKQVPSQSWFDLQKVISKKWPDSRPDWAQSAASVSWYNKLFLKRANPNCISGLAKALYKEVECHCNIVLYVFVDFCLGFV